MCSIKLWAVRALAGLKLSTLSGTNIDCAVYISALSAVKKKTQKTAETCHRACLHAERTSLFFAQLYRMYVCVVGRAGKQALGREGGRTPSTQIIDTILAERNASRSKKSGWWSSALQSDPLHPTWSGEKTHGDALARDTALSVRTALPVPFSNFFFGLFFASE